MEFAKPKKSKPNAFLMFLLEFRRLEKDKGNEMDMNIAQIKAGEIWSVSTSILKLIKGED